MDQAGLNYELSPRKTIEIIGPKQVPINTSGGKKKWVTIMSLINCVKEIYAKITPEVVVQSWKQVGLECPVDRLNIVPEKAQ